MPVSLVKHKFSVGYLMKSYAEISLGKTWHLQDFSGEITYEMQR